MKRCTILKCRRCIFVPISISWALWKFDARFGCLCWSLPTPCAPCWLWELRGQELCRQDTCKAASTSHLQPVLPAPCFLSQPCRLRDVRTQNSGTGDARLGKHSQKSDWKLVWILQRWLVGCWQGVSTKDECWGWLQAGADLKERLVWGCLVCQLPGKIRDCRAGPRQWHLLKTAAGEALLNLMLYIPAVIGQREWKEPLNPPLRVQNKMFKCFLWL